MIIPDWLKNPLIVLLISFLAILLAAFVGVMFFDSAAKMIGGYLGLTKQLDASVPKNEILKFLGIGMGGILLAIQAVLSYIRAKAMEGAANAQANATEEQAKANQKAERGLRQERLKNAIEHLGQASASVRLGGAYELFHLAQDTVSLRQTVLDILCAHIRQTTDETEYLNKNKAKPSVEIQSLLTLLFVEDHHIFKGLHINLQGSWLVGAKLENARLGKANLSAAHLNEAWLNYAYLQGVNLLAARLQGAFLVEAHLQGVELWGARLQGANLFKAYLQGASLVETYLHGTNLFGAQLQRANFWKSQLQAAALSGAQLQGAVSYKPRNFDGFVGWIRESIGVQSDLSGAIFKGGLKKEEVDALVNGLSDKAAIELRKKLAPHIGQPKNSELPENSGVVTGVYSEEEAEEWIAEYERATSEAD